MPEPTKPKTEKSAEQPPIDHALRNHFAGIALAEIVRNQMANNRFGQEDVAASYAWRYADRMLEAGKKVSRATVVSRGVVMESLAGSPAEPPPGAPAPLDALAQVE